MAERDYYIKYETDFNRLQKEIKAYSDYAGNVIDEVLITSGAEQIIEDILPLMPMSGRTWRGKRQPAKTAEPFQSKKISMGVEINAKNAYHYLYFPNDGTNTMHHAGEQYFMERGLEAATPKVIDMCIDKLTEIWR